MSPCPLTLRDQSGRDMTIEDAIRVLAVGSVSVTILLHGEPIATARLSLTLAVNGPDAAGKLIWLEGRGRRLWLHIDARQPSAVTKPDWLRVQWFAWLLVADARKRRQDGSGGAYPETPADVLPALWASMLAMSAADAAKANAIIAAAAELANPSPAF